MVLGRPVLLKTEKRAAPLKTKPPGNVGPQVENIIQLPEKNVQLAAEFEPAGLKRRLYGAEEEERPAKIRRRLLSSQQTELLTRGPLREQVNVLLTVLIRVTSTLKYSTEETSH